MDLDKKSRDSLKRDIQRFGVTLDVNEWDQINQRCKFIQFRAGDKIQNQARVADSWIYISDGIAASEQSWRDGTSTIARFFEAGNICANMTSVWIRDISADDLVALTEVSGLAIPDDIFRREYLEGGAFGIYLRLKMIDAHLFAKELICAKTSGRTEVRYQFLKIHQPDIIASVTQKDIARFLGVTPQGFSRFLRRQKPDAS
ncbi:Crp/Fnr family transcriptional regulator [Roseibium sp.]|uniref:Crp/Fnr family transcriptional regulator n=1 Tax=Roseibium sp. TaxID=1936156 RepID=UPI003BA96426